MISKGNVLPYWYVQSYSKSMDCIYTSEDIKKLGTILGIWAHPDDETFSMAGIMAAAANNGQKVVIVTATRGEAGVQDESRWPANRLAEIRTKESDASLRILGVTDRYWLDYPDGNCMNINLEEAASRIVEIINKHQPNSVITFGPEGMTGHDDHKTASVWASVAIKSADSKAVIYHAMHTQSQYENMIEVDKKLNVYFNIDKPPMCEPDTCDIHFKLDDYLYDKKLAALRAMPSQTEAMLKQFENSLRDAIGTEAFVRYS